MFVTPALRRVLAIFVIVPAIVAGTSSVANAQEIPASGGIVLEELPGIIVEPIMIQSAPISSGDLTGEGGLIGMPTGPITVEPAPSTSAPQPGAAPSPSTVTASDIAERGKIWDVIFDGSGADVPCVVSESNAFCVPNS